MVRRFVALALAVSVLAPAAAAAAPSSYDGMLHWRNVGPFRGGRTNTAVGVPGDPRTFYSGAVGGGLWKTTNAGVTWKPIMDGQPVASIGAVAVAPSDPNVVYAGSGESDMRSDIVHGNGMYRSTDAGATWQRSGLEDSRQIGRILVDPADPKTLLVAALGHAYGPNETRGVYRSTDGGASWTRVLFRDRDTGAIDLAADPAMHVVYASLWQTRRPAWSVYPPSNGPGSGLWKSTDGGVTWSQLRGNGLPSADLGKIGLAVAPSEPNRVYAIVDAKEGGLYRSDDAGATWKLADKDRRLWQRGWYFEHVTVDPKNADLVYISDTAFYRSRDGGASFTAIKGSPDGDDFHRLWIDPTDSARMVLASDQGTVVSIDGGASWSSWFNQPTGQFYHVAADNAFRYHLFGAQQDSGAAMTLARSDHKGIEERDWRPINAGGESNAIAPDPKHLAQIYGGEVDREDLETGQVRTVSPTVARPGEFRAEWTMPLAFSPVDGRTLFSAHQNVYRSRDGGNHWATISPDLTRPLTPRRGVVYWLAPSPRSLDTLWAGTDDGLVQRTSDGGRSWHDVTPPGVGAWSKVAVIEASHFDVRRAYVAIDRHRLDDDRPYLYATRDGGATWRSIAAGIPDGSFVNVIREDPQRAGLLYAGTETGVFVSLNDGASWTSLQLNMPVVSVRDLIVHDGDLAIATHGRAFWVLDDVAPLRQLAATATNATRLFAPSPAVRVRPYGDEAEASPPEVPLGENPPYGAPIDYALAADGPVQLAIADARGSVVRRWSSSDPVHAPDPAKFDYPAYWLSSATPPPSTAGMHRFYWDFREGAADGVYAPPGRYTVTLTAGGRSSVQPLLLRRDPRVHATDADLVAQAVLARQVAALRTRVNAAVARADAARARPGANTARIDALAGTPPAPESPRGGLGTPPSSYSSLRWYATALGDLQGEIESADAAPTANERDAWSTLRNAAETRLGELQKVLSNV